VPALLPTQIDPLEQHEIPPEYDLAAIRELVAWCKDSEGAEMANAQRIFGQLCKVLGVPEPDLKKAGGENRYVYEEDVKHGKSHRRIDVYRRGSFVFEAKQGVNPLSPRATGEHRVKARAGHSKTVRGAGVRGSVDWVDAMRSGRHQAGNYAVHVADRGDPKPPFVIVADVGHRFWIWSSFSRDARDDYGDFEILAAFAWDDLERPAVFKLLRQIWLEPEALNEEARGHRVTAEIADKVGRLAIRLEKRFHSEAVGDFLMKCVFTMFAEDVGFLPMGLFTERLTAWLSDARSGHPERFVRGLRAFWLRMRDGGDLDTGHEIRRFNGYLFREPEPLALDVREMEDLLVGAKADWRKVSPAIFGTLLERALSAKKRQRLGAHYTPEAYIRRLVERTIMAPLREEWTTARATMERELRTGGDVEKARQKARDIGHRFRMRLTTTSVLDPACGSGNFLYVALKELKRLEGEVVRALEAIGDKQTWFDMPGDTVHPAQFFGIEIDPWAAKIAELVLWIGYLQWQMSARRVDRMPPPLLQDLHHIQNADALIAPATHIEGVYGDDNKPVMRARGVTDKKAEREMIPVTRFLGVERAEWPAVEFIVGNPPFLGNKRLNDVLDPGYVDAIKGAYPDVPGTADLVMFWWWRCAELLHKGAQAEAAAIAEAGEQATTTKGAGKGGRKAKPNVKRAERAIAAVVPLRRFGLVTTNSITQKLNRAVVADALSKKGVKLAYAIPDHPWFDEGAAVRIAMTVGTRENIAPVMGTVTDERKTGAAELEAVKVVDELVGPIYADLSEVVDISGAQSLAANGQLAFQGITLVGEGFRLSKEDMAGLGVSATSPVLKPYLIGRDLVQRKEERWVIDFFGLSAEQAAKRYPRLYEHVVREVKPQRDRQNDRQRKDKWWLFGRSGTDLRAAITGVTNYIATCRTSKHRVFVVVAADTLPDTKVVAIALENTAWLAVLSSRVHECWSLRVGGWLGVGNDPTYNHLDCFGKFPFPSLSPEQSALLRSLGERLDVHRKARQAEHPALTLTDAYNVMEKLRAQQPLDKDEQRIRDMALADTLLDIHDRIDRATLAAYGWPTELSDDEIIAKLVALNAERAAEEKRGIVRWLRPDHQAAATQAPLPGTEAADGEAGKPKKGRPARVASWPADMPARIRALSAALREYRKNAGDQPLSARAIAAMFQGAKLDDVEITLQCAAAADAVARVEDEQGGTAWMARAT